MPSNERDPTTSTAGTMELRDGPLDFISHELRSPLTIIAGAARVLAGHHAVAANEELRPVVDDLATATRRLELVVANLLVAAGLEQDASVGEPLPVATVVADAIRESRRYQPDLMVLTVPGQGRPIVATSAWTRHILLNLLLNASRYGTRDRPVVVEWDFHEEFAFISVCSAGEQFDAEIRDRWFEPFYRSPGHARRFPGAGLGLTVARMLAEKQGGHLSAEEWRAEPGTRLTLSLPALPI